MTKNLKTLERVATEAAKHVVGGWDNKMMDGRTNTFMLPTFEMLLAEVYEELTRTLGVGSDEAVRVFGGESIPLEVYNATCRAVQMSMFLREV